MYYFNRKGRWQFRHKLLSVLLSISLMLSLAPGVSFANSRSADSKIASFVDVSDNAWYKSAVDYVTENGLLLGVADNEFAPEANVTRAMVVTVLWRQSGSPEVSGNTTFNDVSLSDWFGNAVIWGSQQGLVSGYSTTKFAPNDLVTREQLAVFMQRFAKKNGEDISVNNMGVLDKYNDKSSASDWAKSSLAWAVEKNIITGISDFVIAPLNNATRAQYASILMRTKAKLPDKSDLSTYTNLTYYHNGNIITVDEKLGEDMNGNPIPARATLAGDGQIIAVAYSDKEVSELEKELKSVKYKDVDLDGQTMIPAFVDPHSHINSVGGTIDASPSAGVTSLENLVKVGRKDFETWVNDHTYDKEYGPINSSGQFWFVTNGYDNTAFENGWPEKGLAPYAMPTKEILDMISTEYPICYGHASGHLGVLNSKGMELLEKEIKAKGLEEFAKTDINWPVDEKGEYTGLINEEGYFVLGQLGFRSAQSRRSADNAGTLANAMDIYASNGITSGIIGAGNGENALLVASISESDRIIDITSLVPYNTRLELTKGIPTANSNYDKNHHKIGAVKMFLDGSPQGKNAWFAVDEDDPSGGGYYRSPNETLLNNADEQSAWWWGEKEGKKFETEDLSKCYANMMKEGIQFHCHANGTAAIQQFIDAYRNALVMNGIDLNDKEAVKNMQNRVRSVVIHSQTITNKQLKECNELGINLSFFTDHVYYYGDYHLYSTLGPIRGQLISPMADALTEDMNINITMHQDSPVAPPNMLFSIYNAANRITRDGQPIGRGSADGSSDKDPRIKDWSNKQYDLRDERISTYDALKCVTSNSAWQNYEEENKGSISVGKEADFAILNINILSDEFLNMAPEEVMNGQLVEQTINDDKVIYLK